jgi:hypothetical protein
MKKEIVLAVVVMVLSVSPLLPIVCCSERSDEEKKVDQWKILLISDIQEERISAQQAVLNSRKDRITYLLSVVNSPVEKGEPFFITSSSRNIAIYLLGKLRAREAVVDLTKWLTPKPKQSQWRLDSLLLSPAGMALFEIGLPSVPYVVEVLKSAETDGNIELRRQCVKIIVSIKGLPETDLLFEEALATESVSAKRDKLKAVLDLLRDQKFRKILKNVHKKVNRLEKEKGSGF